MTIRKFSLVALTFLASLVQTRGISCDEATKYACFDTSDLDASGRPNLYTCAVENVLGPNEVMGQSLLCLDMRRPNPPVKSLFLDECVYMVNQFFVLGWSSYKNYIAAFPEQGHMIFGRYQSGRNSYHKGSHEETGILNCETVTFCREFDGVQLDPKKDMLIGAVPAAMVAEGFTSSGLLGASQRNGLDLQTVTVSVGSPAA